MDDTDQMPDQQSMAQQQHAAAMSSFMSALDHQRDRSAMAAYRTQALVPGARMVGGQGAAGSMARAGLSGGPAAMLTSAMRHPPRLTMMHGGPGLKSAAAMPMPAASAGQKAAGFLHALSQIKLMQRVGQGEHPKGPPSGAAVHSMDPSTSSFGL